MTNADWETLSNQAVAVAGVFYFLALLVHLAEWASLRQPAAVGETYELYGPEVFTLADIVRQTAAQLGLRRFVLPLPDAIGRLQGLLMDHLPAKPFSSDNFRSLLTDSVGGFDGLHRLGIAPTPVARMLPGILGAVGDRQSRLDAYRIRR